MKWVSERRFLFFIDEIKKLFATKSEVPTKVSELENDNGYININDAITASNIYAYANEPQQDNPYASLQELIQSVPIGREGTFYRVVVEEGNYGDLNGYLWNGTGYESILQDKYADSLFVLKPWRFLNNFHPQLFYVGRYENGIRCINVSQALFATMDEGRSSLTMYVNTKQVNNDGTEKSDSKDLRIYAKKFYFNLGVDGKQFKEFCIDYDSIYIDGFKVNLGGGASLLQDNLTTVLESVFNNNVSKLKQTPYGFEYKRTDDKGTHGIWSSAEAGKDGKNFRAYSDNVEIYTKDFKNESQEICEANIKVKDKNYKFTKDGRLTGVEGVETNTDAVNKKYVDDKYQTLLDRIVALEQAAN